MTDPSRADIPPDIERIAVDAPTRARSGQVWSCLVGTESGLLVDPGGLSEDLDAAIQSRGVEHVAVTHHHPDHVGAVEEYAREYDLTVWARYGRTEEFIDATGIHPDRTFREGTVIGQCDVTVVETPGHATEHVAFAAGDALVTGDLVVAEGSVVVGPPDGNMRAYLTSLRRIHARNPALLIPAHGPAIDDSRGVCERLISHRLDREARIRAAVRGGTGTPRELVDEVYEKDVSDVYDLARATVVAHLEKLAVEGDIRWNGAVARPAV